MAVFRVERTGDYTVMSNFHLKDKRLSLKAKGLLSQMLSLPDDWDYTLSGLCFINRESKDAIRSAINELERAGYIRRRQTIDATGKFGANEYSILLLLRLRSYRRCDRLHRTALQSVSQGGR